MTSLPRATHYTWRDWWREQRGLCWLFVAHGPIRVGPIRLGRFRLGGKIPEAWYYLKCRLWRRYNVVHARTLPPTYADPQERLLHVSFAVLEDLIFRERVFERNGAEGDPDDGESWAWALKEMQELWQWWAAVRPQRWAEYHRRLTVWSGLHQRDRRAYTQAHVGWEHKDTPPGTVRWSLPEDHVEPEDTKAAWLALREVDEAVITEEEDAMLQRLIKIRQYMWT